MYFQNDMLLPKHRNSETTHQQIITEEHPGDGGFLALRPSLPSYFQGLMCPDILMVGRNFSLLLNEHDLHCKTMC